MKRAVFSIALILPLVVSACVNEKFKIEMRRKPSGVVERKLTLWTQDGGNIGVPPVELLSPAQVAYQGDGVEEDSKRAFSREFSDTLPRDLVYKDLTNHGSVGMVVNPMGTMTTYVERMPGIASMNEALKIMQGLADTVTQTLCQWIDHQPPQSGDAEKYAAIKTFVQTDMRSDIVNLMLIGWQAMNRAGMLQDLKLENDSTKSEQYLYAEAMRAFDYLVEREYVLPNEVSLDDPERWLGRALVRKLARVCGCEITDLPSPIQKWNESERLYECFNEGLTFAGKTEEGFNSELEKYFHFDLFGSSLSGEVHWTSIIAPITTNGRWNEEKQEVVWNATASAGCMPPQMLYAIWTEPDEKFQQTHFGHIVLEGEHLGDYINWHASLDNARRAEWNAFLIDLQPGKELWDRLSAFRFKPTEKATPESGQSDMPTKGALLILGRV